MLIAEVCDHEEVVILTSTTYLREIRDPHPSS